MQRNSVRRAAALGLGGVGKTEAQQKLSLYATPPTEEVTLDEFETFLCDRLRVLRAIDTLRGRGFQGQELAKKIDETLNRFLPLRSYEGAAEDLRKDHYSHWLLRLAHCKTEERRLWFLTQETTLFRHRLQQLGPAELRLFMAENDLVYEEVTDAEKEAHRDALLPLYARVRGASAAAFERTQFFKLPFTQALPEVSRRSVFLSRGKAFVPLELFVGILTARFRLSLSKSMAVGAMGFGHAAADPRIGPLVSNIEKQYVGKTFGTRAPNGAISPEGVDELAETSMPLCMRHVHATLRREHKLKHQGRLQYGLFLKGAGLSLADAHRLFEKEYTKLMSAADYQKKYAYAWRHMYGQEGKRTDYTPFSCVKIIQDAPPLPGQAHGCPYRHFGEQQLSALLGSLHVTGQDRDAILTSARTHNYQVACYKHFEVSHRDLLPLATAKDLDGVGNHPNSFMAASMELHAKVAKAAGGGVAVESMEEDDTGGGEA